MKTRLAFALLAAGTLAAQTKVSAAFECAAPVLEQTVNVGDRADHKMTLSQRHCAWTQLIEVNGVAGVDAVLSLFIDERRDRVRETGYDTLKMANGDQIFLHYSGNTGSTGSFAVSGGTGKFVGIHGSGTWSSQAVADGKISVRIEGTYSNGGTQ